MLETNDRPEAAVHFTEVALAELLKLFSMEKYKDKALRIVFQGFG